jgi:leader peptidase (prepilin peptidase)/N-methyltransferase
MSTLWLVLWTLVGLSVGSFLNVVADRLPKQTSLLYPPSRCPACERRLSPLEMIPVLSYVALRGRCRTCGARIGLRTLFVESACGLLFALVALQVRMPEGLQWMPLLFHSIYVAVLVLVTVTDLEHGLIFDRVTFPALALAGIHALFQGWPELGLRFAGGALGAGVIALIILLVPGGMGWGDAKLAGFIGLITGLPGLLFALFIGFVSGGLVGGALLVSGKAHRGDTLPLGPFLALGGVVTLLYEDVLMRVFQTLSAVI